MSQLQAIFKLSSSYLLLFIHSSFFFSALTPAGALEETECVDFWPCRWSRFTLQHDLASSHLLYLSCVNVSFTPSFFFFLPHSIPSAPCRHLHMFKSWIFLFIYLQSFCTNVRTNIYIHNWVTHTHLSCHLPKSKWLLDSSLDWMPSKNAAPGLREVLSPPSSFSTGCQTVNQAGRGLSGASLIKTS